MKKLAFRYEMRLNFTGKVTDHHFILRCCPRNSSVQNIYSLSADIFPCGGARTVDAFGNIVHSGCIAQEHDAFGYRAEGIAFVDARNKRAEELRPFYRHPSPLAFCGERLSLFSRELGGAPGEEKWSGGAEKPLGDKLKRAAFLMEELGKCFRYEKGATTTSTTAEEAFSTGRGVCQDYSHILIALCRAGGIPARYAAGLLLGEGESHSWVEIYHEGAWTGLDPTHTRFVGDDYIRIACGRDYGDCMVNKGFFKGLADQEQTVSAKVEER